MSILHPNAYTTEKIQAINEYLTIIEDMHAEIERLQAEIAELQSEIARGEAMMNGVVLSLAGREDADEIIDLIWQIRREREAARIAAIAALRSLPYAEYLQTDHWQQLRMQALNRAKFRCQACNQSGILDVHHRTYERRGDELSDDLIALCRDCHATFHAQRKLGE